MPASTHTVSVAYTETTTCNSLSLSHTGLGGDPVAAPSNSVGCSAGEYVEGELINLTASPDTGWEVAGWGGTQNDASTSNSNTVIMLASTHTVSVMYAESRFK